jgi:Rrf2 family nitric oxide-sensitive transcriptional repressor
MQLTQFSDYGLRLVIYLGCRPGQWVSAEEISQAYGISRHHVVKVVQALTELGVVESQRGRGGGMKLAMPPSAINVGWLVRHTEPHFDLVECLEPATNTCPIAPACGLKGLLIRAQQAFLHVLDGCSVEQILARREDLLVLLDDSLRRGIGVKPARESSQLP